MKSSPSILIALGLLLAGCGEKSSPSTQTTNTAGSGGSVVTAPVDYLGAIAKAQQVANKSIDASYLNHAVQQFNAMEGRYPKDLNELAAQHYIGAVPKPPNGKKIVYDSNTGL